MGERRKNHREVVEVKSLEATSPQNVYLKSKPNTIRIYFVLITMIFYKLSKSGWEFNVTILKNCTFKIGSRAYCFLEFYYHIS